MPNVRKPFRIFVVEDDEWYRKLLEYNLGLNPDYEISTFATGKDCLHHLHEQPDLITLDYRLPDMSGKDILKKIKAENDRIQVIVISQQEEIEVAVELLKEGAWDYLVKSKDITGRLLATVHRCRENLGLRTEVVELRRQVAKKYDFRTGIIGDSEAMQKLYPLLEKAAETNLTVMISGETGTGKEVAAKAIHFHSRRAQKPFVAVNVTAIPSELVESELFGHEKGAFTGAANKRIGKFEEAEGGTLFLDEIGDMDLQLQAKLLRVLQEKEVTRVGSNKVIKIDCRIIVATHRNLKEAVKEGRFREDLYYRLYGFPLELPPLRDRGNDILLLSRKFLEVFCEENELKTPVLTAGAQQKLLSYSFPGNVRELKAIIELAAVIASGGQVQAEDVKLPEEEFFPALMSESLTMRGYSHRILRFYLDRHDNNIPRVAELLDISQATIYRMLKEMQEGQ